jgi:TonB family protein
LLEVAKSIHAKNTRPILMTAMAGLERAAQSLLQQGKTGELRTLFVDYISRASENPEAAVADPACRLCGSILKSEDFGNERSELYPALLSAFDEVERRARTANDGDLLLTLAAISGASGWIRMLDGRIALSDSIYERLSTPGFTTVVDPEGDMVPLYRRAPTYPPAALAQRLEGEVVLEFTITEQGKTDDIKVVRSSDAAFNDMASDALADWLYAPRLVDGVAAEMTGVQMMMRFKLEP